jgi:hypothetical protein
VLAGIKKFSPNNENISFFVPVLEKIIVILPTGEGNGLLWAVLSK